MTPEMFQRMMNSMKQQETAPVASRETTPAEEPQQAKTIEPAAGINSKFTFEHLSSQVWKTDMRINPP